MGLMERQLSNVEASALASGTSLALYLVGTIFNHGFGFYYLVWNLFLAWLPLAFAWILIKYLRKNLWSSWPALGLTFIWLIFLPNSFYMLSDFVHLAENPPGNLLFDTVLLTSFSFTGLYLGFLSLTRVHKMLLSRGHDTDISLSLVGVMLLISSYAIYLGRIIRLNSWDFFTNFVSVLYTVSDQVLHPSGYPSIIGITISFFVLLAMMYLVVWHFSGYNSSSERTTPRAH